MRWIVACAVALAAATAQSATGASITIHAERGGDTIDIRASAVLQADSATAWRVLTDYDRYTEFIPDLRSSRILARRGRTVTVEQSGDAALWLFRMPVDITFEINEIPPSSLQLHAVAGSLRALTSSYALSPAASGIRLRAEAGFDTQPSPGDIAGTRRNMLETVLDIDRYRYALIAVNAVGAGGSTRQFRAAITLHGTTQFVDSAATFEKTADDVVVTGTIAIDESRFGIAPFSILGGAIAVRDRVNITFRICARRLDSPGSAAAGK